MAAYVVNEPRAVTHSEFDQVITAMKKGTKGDKRKGRTLYFDWLVDAMHLSALTGRRREEFMMAKFSDIHLIDGELLGGYIKMINSKYSKQNKYKIGFKNKYSKAPIFPGLKNLLLEMGYENYKETDRYIVAGDETKQRNTLANNLTNAYAYYRNQLGMNKLIQLKGLRKTYISKMRLEFGDNATCFTGHSTGRIDLIHYFDDKKLFEQVKEFKLW